MTNDRDVRRPGALMTTTEADTTQTACCGSSLEVLRVFFKLGVSSFGGPIAHIGYFREEFVVRRKWLDEQAYADLVGAVPVPAGPASSQVGFSHRADARRLSRRRSPRGSASRCPPPSCSCCSPTAQARSSGPAGLGIAARAEARRRGHRGASGLGHGAHALPGPGTRLHRRGRGADHPVQQRRRWRRSARSRSAASPACGFAVPRRQRPAGHVAVPVSRRPALRPRRLFSFFSRACRFCAA